MRPFSFTPRPTTRKCCRGGSEGDCEESQEAAHRNPGGSRTRPVKGKACNDLKQGGGSAGAGSTPTGGSFELIAGSTQVSNVNKSNLTVDASGTAHVEQGAVTWDETWTVPETITPGKKSSVTLGLDVVNNGPTPSAGQYNVGIGVSATGGLAEQSCSTFPRT